MSDRSKIIEETLDNLAKARKAADIRRATFNYFKTLDISLISYHHLPPIGALDQGALLLETEGFPPELLQRYLRDRMYLIDPILIHAQKTTTPFKWSEIGKLTNLRAEQKQLIRDLTEAGLGDGYAVQVFGPGGRNGVFGVGMGKSGRSFKKAILNEIRWVCQAAHLRYCERIEEKIPEAIGLSNREREVLEWVARGKSNSDIATIMGVSAHTVDAYLRRIFLKLGTTDRVTAAIRGVGSGIITGVI
jgi:DNA-binding CsgD family transcriptional regulator